MKIQDLQKDKQYIYVSSYPWNKRYIVTYTGTTRDVKDLTCWFFTLVEGTTVFMSQKEVEELIPIEKTLKENNEEIGKLYDADPLCYHELDPKCFNGIKCKHCSGWFCF